MIVVEVNKNMALFKTFSGTVTEALEFDYKKDSDPKRPARKLGELIAKLSKKEPVRTVSFLLQFGGNRFKHPCPVNEEFLKELLTQSEFFPLYIPAAHQFIKMFCEQFNNIKFFAFFETSFFCLLPDKDRTYPIADKYFDNNGSMKWGYNGIFHAHHATLFDPVDKVISVVLDRQTTVCAIRNGKPLTVSLGCTPLEGIMSQRSCGDIDPGIIVYLMKEYGYSIYKIDDILKKESGFYGMTGYDLTLGQLISLYGKDEKVTLAFDVYKNHMLKYIGDSIATMGGFDRLVFSGCNAETLRQVVYMLLKDMSFLGISLAEMPWDTKSELVFLTLQNSQRHAYMNSIDKTDIVRQQTLKLMK